MTILKHPLIGKGIAIIFNVMGIGFILYILATGWFMVAPNWVGSKGHIEKLYSHVTIETPIEEVEETISLLIKQDHENVLIRGESGVFHEREDVLGAESQIIVTGIRGEYICQGILYFDENEQLMRKGEILCID